MSSEPSPGPLAPELIPWDLAVGKRVRQLRKYRGYTCVRLAEKLGWPSSTLKNLEAGQFGWSLRRLIQVSRALDLHPCDVLKAVR